MIAPTPATVEHAFARNGVLISPASAAPEICYPGACTGVDLWGGHGRPSYFKPRAGKDFLVVLFTQRADAAHVAQFEASKSGLGVARRGRVLLLYYKLSSRIAKLRAALAALPA